MADKKLVKVTLEFANGEVHMLEGEQAEKWHKHANSNAQIAAIHGMNAFDTDPIKWTIKEAGSG